MAEEVTEPVHCPSPKAVLVGLGATRVPHHYRDSLGRWTAGRVKPHGHVKLRVEVCKDAYTSLGRRCPCSEGYTVVSGLADTRAQMCVTRLETAAKLGIRRSEMIEPALKISVARILL